jgi:glucosylceramidase
MPTFVTTEHGTCAPAEAPRRTAAGTLPVDLRITDSETITWRGFGACFNELGWKALGHLDLAARSALLDAFFSEDGHQRFRFCRLPIGANDYSLDWYSHSEVAGDFEMQHHSIERDRRALLPYLREALARQPGLELFASPWSPPVWLKDPPVHNFGTLIQDDRHLEAYALYFVRFIQAYAREGVSIHQIHVQNEPVSSQKFPSCVVTGPEFARFIGRHLGPAFERAGINAEIWLGTLNLPETDHRRFTTSFNDYVHTVMQYPEAARHIRGVGYQWAGKYALPQHRLSYPELPLVQTENECGDGSNSWQHAWYVSDLVQHYLNHDAQAYVYWNPVLEPGGHSSWGWPQNAMVTIDPATRTARLNPEYHLFRHYAASIPAGARRLLCQGPWTANSLAHRHPDGTVSVVVRNPFAVARSLQISIAGSTWDLQLSPNSLTTAHLT